MSSLPPDPWKALGVDRNADKSEIRTAYKKLVLKCHPDKVQDATLKAEKQEEFQKVQQAWELLNNDIERAKYEAQLAKLASRLHETPVKNSANTSVPRTYYANVNIRTAEPPSSRYKGFSSSGKGYNHSSPHTRSNEEVPSARTYTYDEADLKTARRAASYDKVSSDDRRTMERKEKEDKRRRKEEEELRRMKEERDRERERDREKDREKKKKLDKLEKEKEKERERRRDEEKRRQHSKVYVEAYNDGVSDFPPEVWVEDEEYVTASRSKKERSSSKKHEESRDRDRERQREREREQRDRERERERDKSASRHAIAALPEHKHMAAMDYITKARGSLPEAAPAAFWKSESPQDSFLAVPPTGIPAVPTPPPVEPAAFEEDSIQRSARKAAAARRPSHDTSRSSKEKFELHEIPELMTPSRSIPIHTKSSYTKAVPESPPRMNRSHTTPHESYDRPVPGLSRHQTWAAGDRRSHDYDDYGSDDDRERRRERRRRNRSPEVVYKIVDGIKATKLDKQYSYGESPTSRRHVSDSHDAGYSSAYGTSPMKFKVKESRRYGPEDVQYATYEQQPSSYYGEYVAAS
ncbi:hypothetical protein QBC38DRAFT_455793 [Podospora fimiseda]|uniref:J domain-containing protein n=1 Tax=Podospora fimiseda TaxID=252190 RepID=A0AAN7BP15_9PEZI|nr:hypothetical protein QBC38DRAFT_455793 [Podospora fimiseda]